MIRPFLLLATFLLAGQSLLAAPLRVLVTLPPQQWFVEQLAPPGTVVQSLLQPGDDPHTFQIRPRQLRDAAAATVWFQIGIPLEQAIAERLGELPNLQMVNVAAHLTAPHGHDNHEHGQDHGDHDQDDGEHKHHEHEHVHAHDDPHVWLSCANARAMLSAYADALPKVPAERLDAAKQVVNGLKERLTAQLAPYRGRSFLVFHPAWTHFAAEFDLHQISVERDGHAPRPRQLRAVLDQARDVGLRDVVAQPQVDSRLAAVIAGTLGGEVVILDPLAADWPAMMQATADALAATFAEAAAPPPSPGTD